jgi:endoglucanase
MLFVLLASALCGTKYEMRRGLNIAWHNWWPQFYNADTVNHIVTDFHANIIRACIGVDVEKGWRFDKANAYKCLYAVIDACIAKQVPVIVDWQAFKLYETDAKEFFREVATKYKNSPYIIYDILNEPDNTVGAWANIKPYAETMIKFIRGIDTQNNLIIIPTPNWDQYVKQAAADPITIDSNIAYAIHIYAGSHPLSYLDDAKEAIKTIKLFGVELAACNSDGDGPMNKANFQKWIDFYEAYSVPYLFWSVEAKNEGSSILKTSGSWTDLSEWGKVCKEIITSKQ